jgi:hypothetical protein
MYSEEETNLIRGREGEEERGREGGRYTRERVFAAKVLPQNLVKQKITEKSVLRLPPPSTSPHPPASPLRISSRPSPCPPLLHSPSVHQFWAAPIMIGEKAGQIPGIISWKGEGEGKETASLGESEIRIYKGVCISKRVRERGHRGGYIYVYKVYNIEGVCVSME